LVSRATAATSRDMTRRTLTQAFVGGILLALLQGCAWLPKPSPPRLVGNWTNPVGTVWMIKADGTFDVDLAGRGRRDAWGKYEVNGSTVTLIGTGGLKPKDATEKGFIISSVKATSSGSHSSATPVNCARETCS